MPNCLRQEASSGHRFFSSYRSAGCKKSGNISQASLLLLLWVNTHSQINIQVIKYLFGTQCPIILKASSILIHFTPTFYKVRATVSTNLQRRTLKPWGVGRAVKKLVQSHTTAKSESGQTLCSLTNHSLCSQWLQETPPHQLHVSELDKFVLTSKFHKMEWKN